MYMVIWNKYHRKLQSSNMATACHQICFICYHWSVGYAERKRTKTIRDNMTFSVRKTWPPSGIIACWKNVHASKQQLCQQFHQVHAMVTNSWLKKKKKKRQEKKDGDNITSLLQQHSAESLTAMPVMGNSFVFVSFNNFFLLLHNLSILSSLFSADSNPPPPFCKVPLTIRSGLLAISRKPYEQTSTFKTGRTRASKTTAASTNWG